MGAKLGIPQRIENAGMNLEYLKKILGILSSLTTWNAGNTIGVNQKFILILEIWNGVIWECWNKLEILETKDWEHWNGLR